MRFSTPTWADTLVHAAGLRLMVALVLSSPEFDKFSVSKSDLSEIQQEIVGSSWPEDILNTLTAFKMSDEDRTRLFAKATSMLNEITEVTVKPAGNLNDPNFRLGEIEVRYILKAFAMA
jgi:hypothetical protein